MDMQKLDDVEDDIINSLAILRSFHRKEKDHIGVKLVTNEIKELRIFFNELRKNYRQPARNTR